MNKLTSNNQNKIKQPSQCCIHCGKSYIKRVNLDKHLTICELLQISKSKSKNSITDEDEPIPSQRKMFEILIELGERYNKLEDKVEELSKWVVKKKKKINVLEWLNTNIHPNIVFDAVIDKIEVNEDDISKLLENSYYDVMNDIFSRNIYNFHEKETPIFASSQKQNIFYVYENNNWLELNKEVLIKFLNKVHTKVLKTFWDWKNSRKNEIKADEKLSNLCDKALVKLVSVEFKQDSIYLKARSMMYSRMKIDMKSLIEVEIEL